MSAIIFLLCLWFASDISATNEQNEMEPPLNSYLLPNSLKPYYYWVNLTLEGDTNNEWTFSGNVSINVTATGKSNIISFNFHQDLNIYDVELFDYYGYKFGITRCSLDMTTDLYTIHRTDNDVSLDKNYHYTLNISFKSEIKLPRAKGLYKDFFKDSRDLTYMITTSNFEPIAARRIFPCFDEPHYKAVFDVSITSSPDRVLFVYFNTERKTLSTVNGEMLKRDYFRTPLMSPHMLSFLLTDQLYAVIPEQFLDYTDDGDAYKDGKLLKLKEFEFYTKYGVEEYVQSPLKIANKLFKKMQELLPFSRLPTEIELYRVALLPNFEPDISAHWGLIKIREDLVFDEGSVHLKSIFFEDNYQKVFGNIVAKMWFGDLITTDAWTHQWLHEAIAKYCEYHLPVLIKPESELHKKIVIDELMPALKAEDAGLKIILEDENEDAYSPKNLSKRLRKSFISKGAALLRSVEAFPGNDYFNKILVNYSYKYIYDNTNSDLFWKICEISRDRYPQDLPSLMEIMKNWVTTPGYPIIKVERTNPGMVKFSQTRKIYKRKTINGTRIVKYNLEPRLPKWYIPLRSKQSSGLENITWIGPQNSMETAEIPILYDNWIIVNHNFSGYFRVTYDEELYRRILKVLSSNNTFEQIDEMDRAILIDDLFNLARKEMVPYKRLFQHLNYLTHETSYYVWSRVFDGFDFLFRRFLEFTDIHNKLKALLLRLVDPLYKQFNITDVNPRPPIFTQTKALACKWACRLGQKHCVERAKLKFENLKIGAYSHPLPDIRPIILCTVLYHYNSIFDWEFIFNLYEKWKSYPEQESILKALGCMRDGRPHLILLKNYILNPKFNFTTVQHHRVAFRSIYEEYPEHASYVLDFMVLEDNFLKIQQLFTSDETTSEDFENIFFPLVDGLEVEHLEKFSNLLVTNETEINEMFKEAAQKAIEGAYKNRKWATRNKRVIWSLLNETLS